MGFSHNCSMDPARRLPWVFQQPLGHVSQQQILTDCANPAARQAGSPHLTRGKDGETEVRAAALLGVHTSHHLRAVLDCLRYRTLQTIWYRADEPLRDCWLQESNRHSATPSQTEHSCLATSAWHGRRPPPPPTLMPTCSEWKVPFLPVNP
jgi:hypothetical protein